MASTAQNIDRLKALLQTQANKLVAAGTGQLSFKDPGVEKNYKRVDLAVITGLRDLGLKSPFPWRWIAEWYGLYSQGNHPTYNSRRLHIAGLVNPILEQLDELAGTGSVHDPGSNDIEPTWDGINARINGLIHEYCSARDKDTWQDVGRRAREVLIDLGKLIANPSLVPVGSAIPKAADAKAWFDLFVAARASGSEHAELRALMKKTWDLAQKVTHGDIGDIDAFAAAQATVMLVRTSQKMLSDPDPRVGGWRHAVL